MSKPGSRPAAIGIALCGLVAFALLTFRFSPNWVAYAAGLRDAKVGISTPTEVRAVDNAILGAYSARGFYVLRQARDLGATIDDPRNKIIRWRLLVPALGRVLHLPDWLTLGLAQAGCLALAVAFAALGFRFPLRPGWAGPGAVCLAVIAGAGATFVTSMGILGYYDSWLALALLGAAFARRRWVVWLACLLGPWIDERFVIGLPLALAVRWFLSEDRARVGAWIRGEALVPLVLAGGYAVLRLALGGSGGSQTVGQYLDQFVFAEKMTLGDRLFGGWEGLRLGWVLVAAAILGSGRTGLGGSRRVGILLAAGVALTALIGLFTALDLGRSMVLVISVVPLGWIMLGRSRVRFGPAAAVLLAGAALVLPAHHVVGNAVRPVDNFWSPPTGMLAAQNNLGWIFGHGEGVPRSDAQALKWFRRAAEQGNPEAEHNLGVMYASGQGVPRDGAEAVKWYRKAAEQGLDRAQYNLGVRYAQGDGVAREGAEAVKWLSRAGAQGNSDADYNLGVMYANGVAVPRDGALAVKWYRLAAGRGNASAPNNLGVLYVTGNGVEQDLIQACRWFMVGTAMGSESAKRNLAYAESAMGTEQIAEAARLARTQPEPGGVGGK